MGASGGISYVVLKKGADYSQFAFLMEILPVNISDAGVYDYESYDPPASSENLFEAYWRDTYPAFCVDDDLRDILEDIFEDFESSWTLTLTSDYTWREVLEDWDTCSNQNQWPISWKLVAKSLHHQLRYISKYRPINFVLFDMTLKEWAQKVQEMIVETGYQETWT